MKTLKSYVANYYDKHGNLIATAEIEACNIKDAKQLAQNFKRHQVRCKYGRVRTSVSVER